MLGISYYEDNRLTDGGEIVSFTHRLRSTPQKQLVTCFSYSFLLEGGKSQGLVRLEGLGKLKKKKPHLVSKLGPSGLM
jgi:hypothetical protein